MAFVARPVSPSHRPSSPRQSAAVSDVTKVVAPAPSSSSTFIAPSASLNSTPPSTATSSFSDLFTGLFRSNSNPSTPPPVKSSARAVPGSIVKEQQPASTTASTTSSSSASTKRSILDATEAAFNATDTDMSPGRVVPVPANTNSISSSTLATSPTTSSSSLPTQLPTRPNSNIQSANSGSPPIRGKPLPGGTNLIGSGGGSAIGAAQPTTPKTSTNTAEGNMSKVLKLTKLLHEDAVVDLSALRKLSWSGIPPKLRPLTWKLLLGYLPANRERRAEALDRKRKEYHEAVSNAFSAKHQNEEDNKTLSQIRLDLPRTSPDIPLFQNKRVQDCMERMLYVWAVRHPASSYVQGMNDIITPFFLLFLFEHLPDVPDYRTLNHIDDIPTQISDNAEADAYWCLSKFLDGIQDHYTPSQPGIQKVLFRMKELVRRIDEPLAQHLEKEGCEFILFAFRWMNCLLMRELPLHIIIRLWDTYLAEGNNFAALHVYVCASLLLNWAAKLKQMDFQNIIFFLQDLPTSTWTNQDVELLLSQAFLYQSLFQNAPSHLKTSNPIGVALAAGASSS